MKKLVSVLIPAYNHEDYVIESIKSVINQTYRNIELLIIDDGSTDSTKFRIDSMKSLCEERFINFYFVHQSNKGTCATLNSLLSRANGEYLLFLASDDRLARTAIEKEVYELDKDESLGLVVGKNLIIDCKSQVCFWDIDKKVVYSRKKSKWNDFTSYLSEVTDVNFNSDDFGNYWFLLNSNHIPNGYLIRSNLMKKVGHFTNDAPLEDYWLMLQLSKYCKFKYIQSLTFFYRWHKSNTILQTSKIDLYTKKTIENEVVEIKKAFYNNDYNLCLNNFRKEIVPELFKFIETQKQDIVLLTKENSMLKDYVLSLKFACKLSIIFCVKRKFVLIISKIFKKNKKLILIKNLYNGIIYKLRRYQSIFKF